MVSDIEKVQSEVFAATLVARILESPKDVSITLKKEGDYFTVQKAVTQKWIPMTEAAEMLGISTPTFRRRYLDKHIKRGPHGFARVEVVKLKEAIDNGKL